MMNRHAIDIATNTVLNYVRDNAYWLVAKARASVTVDTPEECALCGGLMGGIMFPELVSISQETLIEVADEHEHYKHVFLEAFRVSAHAEIGEKRIRIVPDEDLLTTSSIDRISVHDVADVELCWVDTPTGPLSSLELKFEVGN